MVTDYTFVSQQPVTQEAFWRWVMARGPRLPGRHELINGRIVVTPPAGYPHGSVDANAAGILRNFVLAHKLGRVFGSSQGFELPTGDTVEPDASFVSHARWDAGPATALVLRGGGCENAATARRGERFRSEVLAGLEVSVEEVALRLSSSRGRPSSRSWAAVA
jgi:hypothetical protein